MNLSVTASGSGTVTYQWLRKGKAIPGATSTILAVTGATYADSGWYLVDATDGSGTTRSKPIFVTVAPAVTQVRSWASGSYLSTDFDTMTDAIAVATGITHSVALKRDGTLREWQGTWSLRIPFPGGPTDIVSVAVGEYHTIILRSDGTVAESLSLYSSFRAVSPSGLSDVVAICSSQYHAMALKTDGTVVSWGNNSVGQSSVPPGLANVVAIACGYSNSFALKSDGTVVIWGDNSSGLVDETGLAGITAIAGYHSHFVALKIDGTAVAKGHNDYGQCDVPAGLTDVTSVAAGRYYSLALKRDGTAIAWPQTAGVPSTLTDVFGIAGGEAASFALRDASADTVPNITVAPLTQTKTETQTATLTVTAVGVGPMTYQWRKNGVDIANATTSSLSFPSVSVFDAGSYDVVITNYRGSTTAAAVLTVAELPAIDVSDPLYRVIQPGASTTLVPTYSGPGAQSYQWFRNGRVLAGATGSSLSLTGATLSDNGYYFADITDANGVQRSPSIFVAVVPVKTQVRAWGLVGPPPTIDSIIAIAATPGAGLGLKRNGVITQLGAGGIPLPVGLSGVVGISGSQKHALALRKDGTVVAWGDNSYGQTTVPVGLSRVVAASAGSDHSLALKSDGTVVAWGSNSWGQCNVPAGLSHVVGIFASNLFSLAIKDDGTVITWAGYSPSQPLGSQTGVTAIASYPGYHLALLKQDGSVAVIGGNEYGQSTLPPGLSQVKAVAAGAFHTLALKNDGTVVCWGRNSNGEATVPDNLANVFGVSAGLNSSYAIRDATSDIAPVISNQPVTQTKIETGKVTFSVSVTGPGPYTYQWRKNGIVIAGATTSTFKLVDLALSDAGNYGVVITNYVGSTTSATATLTVNAIPVVTSLSPTRQVIAAGQSVNLSVTATGTGSLSYQWTHDGLPIAGATSAALSVTNFTRQAAGYYLVHITDSTGTRISNPMFLIFAPGTGPSPVTQIRGWGINNLSQIDIPSGLTDAVAVAAREYNPLALKADGTAVSWGTYVNPVPAGITGLVAIAAGADHAAAVKSDGTVVAWGNNTNGQTNVPAGLSDVVAVACGSAHTLALKNDGTVIAWGAQPSLWYSSNGEAIVPTGLKNVVAIAAGNFFSAALRSDGTIISWGGDPVYRAGLDELTGIRLIAAGSHHILLRKFDGTVVRWSQNNSTGSAPVVDLAYGATAFGPGSTHSLALKSDGTVIAWMEPSWTDSGQTTVPEGLPNVFALACGRDFSLALRDASADAAPSLSTLPARIVVEDQSTTWTVIATGAGPFTYLWRKNGVDITGATSKTLTLNHVLPADAGSYDVVVTNYKGTTASNAAALSVLPLPVVTASSPVRQVFEPGQNLNLTVTATGTGSLNFQWLHNGLTVNGATSSNLAATNLSLIDGGWYAVDVTDGNGTRRSHPFFVIVAPSITKVVGWGSTNYASTLVSTPTNDIVAVSAGGDRSLALRRTGAVLGFGGTYAGEATILAGLSDVVAVEAGASVSLALKSDGTAFAWGNNSYGQTNVPIGLSHVVAIAAGGNHVLALTADGHVVGWGQNNWGQTTVPASLSGVIAIGAGNYHSLALKNDGTVVAWGDYGQSDVPTGLTDVIAIAAGPDNSFAVRKDGSVVGWGANGWWESSVPEGANFNVLAAAGGFQYSYLLKRDGTLYGWGSNVGYTIDTPKDLAAVYAISLKSSFTLALVGQSAPAIFVQPENVTQKEQQRVMLSVGATGLTPMSYEWRKNGVIIPGGTSANLVFDEVMLSDAGSYDIVVTNSLGSATSKAATLTVIPVPVITSLTPARQIGTIGGTLDLAVSATGTGPLTYQWSHDGHDVTGASQASLHLANLSPADNGWYIVSITDQNGTRRSRAIFLTVVTVQTQVRAWGDAALAVPASVTDVVAIAAGSSHATAIRRDGTVVEWGSILVPSSSSVAVVAQPAGLTDVVAVSAGYGSTLALKSDGTVVGWGLNDLGQVTIPAGLTGVVKVSTQGHSSLALKSNGTVVAWGDNYSHQSTVPPDARDIVDIAAGGAYSYAVKRNGVAFYWGGWNMGPTSAPYMQASYLKITPGLVLRSDHTVYDWRYYSPPILPAASQLGDAIAIATGSNSSMLLKSDLSVLVWGSAAWGGTPPADLHDVIGIASGGYFALALVEVVAPSNAIISFTVE